MKKQVLLAAVAAIFTASAWSQEGGRITKVTLYPGAATIERAAPVTAGQTRILLTGLPASFDPRTLRIEADPGIRIGEVAVRDLARTEAPGAREAQLESRIQALRDEKSALDVEVKTAELVRDYLVSLNAQPGPDDKAQRAPVDPKNIPAVLEAIRRGGADSYGTIQRAELRKRELDKQIAAAERDLGRLKSGARDSRTVAISLHASAAGAVRASYQVPNAGWRPVYRAGLDSAGSRVELERQATVTQRTGEDWSGVQLRLSTGQPRPAVLIDPHSWQLAIRPPVAAAEMRDQASVMAQAPASAGARSARLEKAHEPVAEFQTEYATEFEVAGKVDIAADGRQVNVSLTKQWVPVKQKVRVVPRRDVAAMVTAEADKPEGVWLPGDVQLYRDGAYIGSTHWAAQAKDGLVLPFGRDDRVVVTVNRVKNRTGNSGFVGTRAERQIADLYTIVSRHKSPVELLLLEASPVAVSDKISVESKFEPKPKTDNWEDRRGVVAWERSLIPGETLKFVADYTISYPKDAAVVGLP
jgi:uncharacterized protein (TIGR02231 family)